MGLRPGVWRGVRCSTGAALSPQSSASPLRGAFGPAPQCSSSGPEPAGELRRAEIRGRGCAVERGDRHDASAGIRAEQALPGELLPRVTTLIYARHELEHALPPDAREDAQIE